MQLTYNVIDPHRLDDAYDTEEEDIQQIYRSSVAVNPSTPQKQSSSADVAPRSSGKRPLSVKWEIEFDSAYATTNRGKVIVFQAPQRRHRNYFANSNFTSTTNSPAPLMSFPPLEFIPEDFGDNMLVVNGISSLGDMNSFIGSYGGLSVIPDMSSTPKATSNFEESPFSPTMSFDSSGPSDDEEEDLDIEDFIEFGNGIAESSDDEPPSPTTSMIGFPGSTPAKSPAESPSKKFLLGHLHSTHVGSFKNHQENHKAWAALHQHPAQRASAFAPVRTGKSADILTTPVRRRANSSVQDRRRSGRTVDTGHLRSKH